MNEAILTFDLGTTRLKVAGFTLNGALLHQETARHVEHADGAFTWQDADAWWHDALRLGRRVAQHVAQRGDEIVAISLTGRAGAAIFTDVDGNVVVHPWSDDRHRAELAELRAWRRENGTLSDYGAALLAKYLWLVRDDSQLRARIARAFYGKDFLLYRMSGTHYTDPSSGPDALAWDTRALERASAPASLVPTPALPWRIAGGLVRDAADALGLPTAVPVIVGAHDGISANVGAGAARARDYALTLGTHAVVRAVLDSAPPSARRFYGLPPDRHVLGGNAFMGGRAADWFIDVTTHDPIEQRVERFRLLDAEAETVSIGARGVRFLPFLAGRIAPEARPRASASFIGLRAEHGKADLYRAVLEGTAFAIAAVYEQVRAWCGAPAVIRVTGGGAASELWLRILATVLRTPLDVTDLAVEGRGAAIFAAVALGHHADYDAAGDRMVRVTRRVEPDDSAAPHYERVQRQWSEAERLTRALDTLERS
jgi:sugar (pentulose or hexulose) kinase